MTPAKRFLLILAVVAVVGWVIGNMLFGPPGLTADYLETHKDAHEHYIEIIKSEDYKLYVERPALHGPEQSDNPDLARMIAFADEYEALEEYQEQQHRIEIYNLYFDFFNAALLLVLAVYFGRKPLLNLIDTQIKELRERMEELAKRRAEAESRRAAAQKERDRLPEIRQQMRDEAERALERDILQLTEANRERLEQMRHELEDRKAEEVLNAARKVKRELVDAAIRDIEESYRAGKAPEHHVQLVDDFCQRLEQRA